MKKKCYLSRRQFLSLSLASSAVAACRSPLETLVNGLVDGIFTKAQAAEGKETPRNYLYLGLYGAPPRWQFDQPLFPYSPKVTNVHPFVNTRFKSNSGVNAGMPEYVSVPITRNGVTLHMPYLWSCEIPSSDGKTVPMGDLLSNMLIIRGIDMGFDGHRPNFPRLLQPNPAAPSLNGYVADNSEKPVPAVVYENVALPQIPFKSKFGVGRVEVIDRSSNPLARALGVFDRSTDQISEPFVSRRKAMELVINSALGALAQYANSTSPGAEALSKYRGKAETLLKNGVGDLATSYQTLLTKYQTLIARCTDYKTLPIEGLTDKPIPYNGFPGMDPDAINLINNNLATRNVDLRTLLHSKLTVMNLAAGFAVAEYLLLGGYSSTIAIKSSEGRNANLENAVRVNTQTPLGDMPYDWSFDEHGTGFLVSMILNAFVFRAISSCLYEFISQLKSANLFSETVIQIGGEFARNPNDTLNGSNHGYNACVTSLFSGAIQAPMVLGNTNDNLAFDSTKRASAWGGAGKVAVDGTKRNLSVGHASSTVAHLLRVEHPVKNDSSLITEKSNGIEPNIELARSSE